MSLLQNSRHLGRWGHVSGLLLSHCSGPVHHGNYGQGLQDISWWQDSYNTGTADGCGSQCITAVVNLEFSVLYLISENIGRPNLPCDSDPERRRCWNHRLFAGLLP